MPLEHVSRSIIILNRFGYKAKGMITAPLFSLFFKPIDDELVDLFFLHLIYMFIIERPGLNVEVARSLNFLYL